MEKITGITFNVLLLDCEGCHRDFIKTYKHTIANGHVNKIILGELRPWVYILPKAYNAL